MPDCRHLAKTIQAPLRQPHHTTTTCFSARAHGQELCCVGSVFGVSETSLISARRMRPTGQQGNQGKCGRTCIVQTTTRKILLQIIAHVSLVNADALTSSTLEPLLVHAIPVRLHGLSHAIALVWHTEVLVAMVARWSISKKALQHAFHPMSNAMAKVSSTPSPPLITMKLSGLLPAYHD